jgi:hypothetical protein
MGRRTATTGTALATTTTGGTIVHKKQITTAAAFDMVKKLATDEFRARKAVSDSNIREAEKTLGGQTKTLDKSLLDQGRAWMTRCALIARRNAGSGYNTSKTSVKLQSLVGKISAIIGELEALLVTDVEMGLFENVDKDDFLVKNEYRHDKNNPLSVIPGDNEELYDKAEALLAGYEIVDEKKAAKNGKAAANFSNVDGAMYQDEDEHAGD